MHVNIYQHAALVKWRRIKVLAVHCCPPQPICVPSNQFGAKNPTHALELMRSHPLAQRISNDDEGLLFVTPLPLHVLHESGETAPLGRCTRLVRGRSKSRTLRPRNFLKGTAVLPGATNPRGRQF